MTYLLDTNVISEWARPRPDEGVVAWLSRTEEDLTFLSVCTLAELRFGVARMPHGRRRRQLDDWLSNEIPMRFDGRIVAIDVAVADAWGIVHARGKAVGRSIDVMDGLIAATAEVHGMTVVTRDIADFKAVGTPVFNPWSKR
ncbi:MAG: toxin FitB [Hyphomicrobiales bacterium]|nr:toxin FitB [Hyphomicrobiales bacterium]